jgi:methyltransferase (TIGR00027 family)
MMPTSQASQTALTAATARAAHLIVDQAPVIFADTLAATLLGEAAETFLAYHRAHGDHLVLAGARAQVICRSRFTEDRLTEAAGQGLRQYVILGAGLDSFGYRADLARGVRVFEVDHPATQRWKQQSVAAAGLTARGALAYVPIDFETESLIERLRDGGFDPTQPALVSWLGVTMYLTRPAIERTLAELGGLAPGSALVADYMLPEDLRDEAGQQYVDLVAPVAAERGEPWRTFLTPETFSALLAGHGFDRINHLSQRDMVPPSLWERSDCLRPAELSRIAHARLPG